MRLKKRIFYAVAHFPVYLGATMTAPTFYLYISFQVTFHSEIPKGSQYHKFNMGLVSSELRSLADTFCPIINELDVRIDPISTINDRSEILNVTSGQDQGVILSTFCVPIDVDYCQATLSNDNVSIAISINMNTPTPVPKWIDKSFTVSYEDGRVYVFFIGVLKYLNLEMNCNDNSTNFIHGSCNGE